MQREANMPLHQSYQRQVLNMQCFTPQFVSGKIKHIYFFDFLSQSDTDKRLTDLTDTRAKLKQVRQTHTFTVLQ